MLACINTVTLRQLTSSLFLVSFKWEMGMSTNSTQLPGCQGVLSEVPAEESYSACDFPVRAGDRQSDRCC